MKPTPLKEIAQLMGLSVNSDEVITGISVDSRHTNPGDLFFALPGSVSDGHAFIAEAHARGAKAVVVKKEFLGPTNGLPILRSPDVLKSLQDCARNFLRKSNAKIIAITGSLGKTTTKDFITTLLKDKFSVSSSPGNSNSQIGLPFAILNNVQLDNEIIILEMGMTHPGQISKLIDIACPTVSVITSVALVHACNFDSIKEIAHAKAEIFNNASTDLGIYPLDFNVDNILSSSGSCKKISFSTTSALADFSMVLEGKEMHIIDSNNTRERIPVLEFPGDHNRHNFLAATLAARYFGLSWDEIRARIPFLALPERRLQIIEKFGAVFVNDSYNASEVSLRAALNSLPQPKHSGKKIAVLGEMLELGKFSYQCHRAVGEHALKTVDSMLCLGEGCEPIYECWKNAGKPVFWSLDRGQIVDALRSQLSTDDVVLLKGSRAKGLWKVLEEL